MDIRTLQTTKSNFIKKPVSNSNKKENMIEYISGKHLPIWKNNTVKERYIDDGKKWDGGNETNW